jgi:putative ABC transport system permease protein
MFGHAFLTLYRSLTRHRLYAALNVLGLAVGIAVFLVLSLYVAFETSFERWIPQAQSISVVRTNWKFPGHALVAANYTMGGLLDELKEDYPQLVGTRIWSQSATVRQGGDITSEKVQVVDPNFFQVFDLPLVAGDKRTLLNTPDQAVITEAVAKRYFGSTNPIGQRLTLSTGKVNTYRITGVLKDPPRNTDLEFDIVIPLTPQMVVPTEQPAWNHWGSAQLATYFRFPTPAAAQALNAQFDAFTDRRAQHDLSVPDAHKVLELRVVPLLSTHLLDPKDAAAVAMLGGVGVLTLLLAGVNYVNLATARAGLRAREVAIRKVMGATAPMLVAQFMAEALATAAVAALIGMAVTELTLPLVNAAGGLSLKLDYIGGDSVLPLLIAVVLLVGLGAGAYPALVLSRFQAASVLASARTPGGGRVGSRVREVLVAAQFAVAIAFTIATGVILSQSRYLSHADLGFNRNGLIVVKSFEDSDLTAAQRTSLLDLWRTLPGIVGATTADIAPGVDDSTSAGNIKRPGVAGDGPSLNFVQTGPEFFRTYGARFQAGRPLDGDHGLDDQPASISDNTSRAVRQAAEEAQVRNVVLNVNALKVLGFSSPQDALGKPLLRGADDDKFRPMTVVGVIDNIRLRSPHTPVPGTVYTFTAHDIDNGVAVVRYAGADPKAMLDLLQASWRRVAANVPFHAKTIEQSLQAYTKSDDERGRLFTIGAVLAVAIGCVGLYGLASFNTARRVREIGIRKTLGASTADILRLLIGQFLRPVLIANLIAWPLAWLAMRNWLSGFDQRIGLNPLYFIAATLLTLLIAVGTVAGQAFAVARAEPAKALRHE